MAVTDRVSRTGRGAYTVTLRALVPAWAVDLHNQRLYFTYASRRDGRYETQKVGRMRYAGGQLKGHYRRRVIDGLTLT